MALSVVIIAKDEAHIIGNTLQSLQAVSRDIVVVDNGSSDDTIAIGKEYGANVIESAWQGYGPTKNKGIDAAANDWILSLDADEAIDDELAASLKALDLSDDDMVYELNFKTFFCNKWIRFGEWSGDKHIRLFNRKKVRWNDAAVHEGLVFPSTVKIIRLKGSVLHYTVRSREEFLEKTVRYAKLNAEKYYKQGKKPDAVKLYLGPVFSFIKHYVFGLGFLDGPEGFLIAKTNAWYGYLKYHHLRELYKANDKTY